MEIVRGTTPTVVITVKNEMDLTTIQEVWVYIAQQNKVKIDKLYPDVTIDAEHRKMSVKLEQEDTLSLKAKQDALFQIRMLLTDGTALATIATEVEVAEVYKDGIIQ